MSTSDLKALLARVHSQTASQDNPALDAILRVLDRYADAPIDELVASFDKLKPKKRARAVAKTAEPTEQIVSNYVRLLQSTMGDIEASSAIVRRIGTDKGIKKAEAIAIAKAVGIRATSKTTKVQALTQIEGLSNQVARDRVAAERIRRGA